MKKICIFLHFNGLDGNFDVNRYAMEIVKYKVMRADAITTKNVRSSREFVVECIPARRQGSNKKLTTL